MASDKNTLIVENKEDITQYEKETGKKAIWRGVITEGFKKWKQGLKVYKRINDTISIDKDFKDKIYDFCDNFGFIRAKTYRFGADIIIEACNKLKNLSKKFDLDSTKKFISDSIDLCIDTNILNDSEILKYYKTQMNSSINFCEEALNNFKNFQNILKKDLPEDKLKFLIKSSEAVLSYLMDSLQAQKEHVEVLESYLNVKTPIIIKSSKYKVLIVDNDKNVQKLVTSYFKDKNFSTRSAMSSFEALLLLRHSKPEIILLDIALSDINGIDLCKRLRSNRNYRDVKIYFLTAHSDGFKEINDLLEQKVADGLIKKPFGKNDFNFLFKYLESS